MTDEPAQQQSTLDEIAAGIKHIEDLLVMLVRQRYPTTQNLKRGFKLPSNRA